MVEHDKIIAKGPNAMTLLILMGGELQNYGYEVTKPQLESDSWGEGHLFIEVKPLEFDSSVPVHEPDKAKQCKT